MVEVTVILVSTKKSIIRVVTRWEHEKLTIPRNFDVIAQMSRLSLDLYPTAKKIFKVGTIENAVASRFRVVNDELVLCGRRFGGRGFRLLVNK